MRIEFYPTAQSVTKLNGKIAIIIDVLRATSTITTALNNGAKMVIPAISVEEAFYTAKKLKGDVVLGGERNMVKIPGFNFGNSPLEYKKEFIAGKTVILTTSNGTKAIKASQSAEHILIGCFLNASAVAKKVVEIVFTTKIYFISFVCAGTLGEFSLDDGVCAGCIIDGIIREMENHNYPVELSDLAFVCRELYSSNKNNLKNLISHAGHYKKLLELGFEEDLFYCLKKDILSCVPLYDKKNCVLSKV
ncbi:MAG: 2-phosphosulfolactate phosphatase [Thermovenabulum sp.]|uniref:2-phosphosulfolactate phosphatase n=1 Tax=Thermovenabulum sp. TaxID=3100335 RepID=UPI003C7BB402